MKIVRTVNVRQTSDYNFIIYEDDMGFHAAYSFFDHDGGSIRLVANEANVCGYNDLASASWFLSQCLKVLNLTVESVR